MAKALNLSALIAILLLGNHATTRAQSPTEDVTGQAKQVMDDAQAQIDEIAEKVDQNEQAHEVSAGILAPIYNLAETFSFPAFHWLAFAFMVAGVLSFALQLVLAKLIVLAKFGFSLTEILSDALGLIVSLIGLVLTTQAAAENSTFTSSPFAVISATAVGGLMGLVFYIWGQRQEIQAVEGRRKARAVGS